MYAVFESGGKQHRVVEGDTLKLEKLPGEVGQKIEFDNVFLVADAEQTHIGSPKLAGAKIVGEIVEQGRHKKIKIIKFKRRKHHDKQMGHRQWFTAVKIEKIAATAA